MVAKKNVHLLFIHIALQTTQMLELLIPISRSIPVLVSYIPRNRIFIFDTSSLVFALNVNVDVVFKVLRQFLQLKSWKIATLILNVTQIIMHIADHKFFPAF